VTQNDFLRGASPLTRRTPEPPPPPAAALPQPTTTHPARERDASDAAGRKVATGSSGGGRAAGGVEGGREGGRQNRAGVDAGLSGTAAAGEDGWRRPRVAALDAEEEAGEDYLEELVQRVMRHHGRMGKQVPLPARSSHACPAQRYVHAFPAQRHPYLSSPGYHPPMSHASDIPTPVFYKQAAGEGDARPRRGGGSDSGGSDGVEAEGRGAAWARAVMAGSVTAAALLAVQALWIKSTWIDVWG